MKNGDTAVPGGCSRPVIATSHLVACHLVVRRLHPGEGGAWAPAVGTWERKKGAELREVWVCLGGAGRVIT